jgi:CopG family nickel-responsive transcriptional regulator
MTPPDVVPHYLLQSAVSSKYAHPQRISQRAEPALAGPAHARTAPAANERISSGMKRLLARFGVAMEAKLLASLDKVVSERNATRSKVLSDLVRAEVMRSELRADDPAAVSLTLVYDHHVRDLSEKLTAMQHELGERVRATLHIHLSHDLCLEVIVMRGRYGEIERACKTLLAARGVKHGGMEVITEDTLSAPPKRRRSAHRH